MMIWYDEGRMGYLQLCRCASVSCRGFILQVSGWTLGPESSLAFGRSLSSDCFNSLYYSFSCWSFLICSLRAGYSAAYSPPILITKGSIGGPVPAATTFHHIRPLSFLCS